MNDLDKTLRILTYYHTSLRNIGLYTSIAFAALIFSRYWRSKHIGLNLLLILITIIFISLSICIGTFLLQDLEEIQENEYIGKLEKWLLLPKIMVYTNIALLLAILFVFFLQFK
jgi:hypothetical protein